jgi:hypothetical protein
MHRHEPPTTICSEPDTVNNILSPIVLVIVVVFVIDPLTSPAKLGLPDTQNKPEKDDENRYRSTWR